MDLHNLLRKTRKTRKSVKIDETRNTERTLSKETKDDNYQLSKSVKNEVWLRRNNESNNDAPSPERGIGEIQPRLSKSQIKAHRTETLKNVNQTSSKSNTGCTICGGKTRKNRKTRKVHNNRKKRKSN
jgi:hypothetical protein